MSRLIAYFLVSALGAAAAVALVSCGGGSPELLPGNTAHEISENLDTVEQLASAGDCIGAEDAAHQVAEQIDELGHVDKTLKTAQRKGAERLDAVVAADCSPETTESVAPAEIPSSTEGLTTESHKKEKKEKGKPKKPDTFETETTTTTAPSTPTTTTTPTAPTTTPTPPPSEGGGTESPPGGVGPGAKAEGD
jgi:hypothetical protein